MSKIGIVKKVVRKALPLKVSTVKKAALPKLKWTSTQTNLMEVVYMIYLSESLKNEKGQNATISEITKVVFTMFNMEVPKNPTKIIDQLKHRLNPTKVSLLYKVLKILYQIL